jgi:hypothetical protein
MHGLENFKINATSVFTFTNIYTSEMFTLVAQPLVSVSVYLESKTLAETRSTKFCILFMVPQKMLYPDFFFLLNWQQH